MGGGEGVSSHVHALRARHAFLLQVGEVRVTSPKSVCVGVGGEIMPLVSR